MRLKYKPWGKPYIENHREITFDANKLNDPQFQEYLDHQGVYIEVGAGRGDFIIGLAKKFPRRQFLAIEKNLSAASVATKKIVESGLKNIRLVDADIYEVAPFVPDETISGIFLNFSDPWPKKRHAKRRLTFDNIILEYQRILVRGGKIFQKTDNLDLFNYSLENFRNNRWKIDFLSFDYPELSADFDSLSEYEKKFRLAGNKINRLVAKKGLRTYGPERKTIEPLPNSDPD